MILKRTCRLCRSEGTISCTEQEFESWKNGTHIQTAMPKLSVDQRELLISGICGKCFDEMFIGGKEN